MKHDHKIKKAYHDSLPVYDEILRGRTWWSKLYLKVFWGGISDERIADQLLSRIPSDYHGRILDVPVGTGVFTAAYYQALKDTQIVGVDYSEDMLNIARQRFNDFGVNMELMQGDVSWLPFGRNSFDMLISMNGFHAFPAKEKAYQSCLDVLKPGGIFLGCFYIVGELSRGDFLVRHVLSPKGWFTPPFETRKSLLTRLARHYDIKWFKVNGAIASFECVKK